MTREERAAQLNAIRGLRNTVKWKVMEILRETPGLTTAELQEKTGHELPNLSRYERTGTLYSKWNKVPTPSGQLTKVWYVAEQQGTKGTEIPPNWFGMEPPPSDYNQPTVSTDNLTNLAHAFYWETKSDSLHEFIAWANKGEQ